MKCGCRKVTYRKMPSGLRVRWTYRANSHKKESKNLGDPDHRKNGGGDEKELVVKDEGVDFRRRRRGRGRRGKNDTLTSRIYRLVSLKTWSGGDHGLP